MDYKEMQEELRKMLSQVETISEKHTFVRGVIDLVEHEDDLKAMYNWLCNHPNATESEIIMKGLDLNIPRTEPERVIY